MVEVLTLPEGTSFADDAIALSARERFPGMQDFGEAMIWPWLNDNMDMVWHDTPGGQIISLAVKVTQRTMDYFRDLRIGEVALPQSSIKVAVYRLAEVSDNGLCLSVDFCF